MGARLLRPVEDHKNRLARIFAKKEDAWLSILRVVRQQIDRGRRPADLRHVEEVLVLYQVQPVLFGAQNGKVVPNLVHAAGNRGEDDRSLRLRKGKPAPRRTLPAARHGHLRANIVSVWVIQEVIAVDRKSTRLNS